MTVIPDSPFFLYESDNSPKNAETINETAINRKET